MPAQDSPEIPVNENFQALEHMAVYAKDATTTVGLTWGYIGGRWGGHLIAAGTLALPASSTVYITVSRSTGAIAASTTDAYWQNTSAYARVYKLNTGSSTVTSIEDYRSGYGGVHGIADTSDTGGGGGAAPVVSLAIATHPMTLADSGSYLRFTATGAKAASFDGSTVAFAEGQEFHIANRAASGNLTLTPVGGVALSPPKNGTLVLEPGDTVTVKFITASTADVFGSTKAVA
jgi:hypothetical protein